MICQAGVRARRAAEALRAAGADVVVLAGGMDAWNAASPAGEPRAWEENSGTGGVLPEQTPPIRAKSSRTGEGESESEATA